MASHGFRNGSETTATLPDVVPFDIPKLTRLSWELGSRVVDDEESTLHSEWEHTRTSRTLSIFQATNNTVLICVRTPLGRERFYGATRSDLDSVLPELDVAPQWQRAD